MEFRPKLAEGTSVIPNTARRYPAYESPGGFVPRSPAPAELFVDIGGMEILIS